ncbi:MFS transporter, partial [Lactobacillus sp. XV13L]|nr:MFS transporter [Lactobacillus sp. XV13L]
VGIGCVISVLGAFGRLFAKNFVTLMIMLLLFGVYMALLNANTIKILGTWFKQDTNMAMGIFFASASIGITLSQLTGYLFPSVSAAYTFSSVVLLILTICWFIFIKDTPQGEPIPKTESATKYLGVAMKSTKTWLVGLCGGIGTAATMSFTGILPQALINGKGVAAPSASTIAAVATIGSLLGAMFGPTVVSKFKTAKPVMITMIAISAISMFLTWYAPVGGILMLDLVIGGLFGASTGPIMQAMVIGFPEIGPKYAGSAGGLVGTISLLLSYVLPIVVSTIAGHNFVITFSIQALLVALTAVFVLILPDANRMRK